jgi:hypothetical protein
MYAITMDENVFIILEDLAAPTKTDVLSAAPPGQEIPYLQNPSHYRNTFVTLRPVGGLEQLLSQTKAKWVPVRQASSGNIMRTPLAGGQQLTVDGHVYAIGTDWLVRIGNVILASGVVKGMLLEVSHASKCLPVNRFVCRLSTCRFLSCKHHWLMEHPIFSQTYLHPFFQS